MGKLECKLSSSQMIILGFAAVILLGALLLMLPVSSKGGEITPFLDCLLTSTSAVCVTGLVVYDTAAHWTVFGQAIIIVLIQIGGMGVITVAANMRNIIIPFAIIIIPRMFILFKYFLHFNKYLIFYLNLTNIFPRTSFIR